MREHLTHARRALPPLVLSLMAVLTLLAAPLARPAAAQSLFSPAITVNGDVITWFEIDQRAQFLRILRAPANPQQLAREQLIDDRIKRQAIAAAGIELPPEAIEEGILNFAARVGLELDQLYAGLASEGIARETLRDFVATNIGWREYVRARFLARARPTDAEIDRALGAGGVGGVSVLLSEIIMPITPQNAAEVEALAEELSQIRSIPEFAEAATRFSAAETRNQGGRLDWLALDSLPSGLRPAILELSPGEVTAPVPLGNAIGLFQMRDIREITGGAPRYAAIEYATYAIPGGRSPEAQARAADISARVDTCDDLYGIAKDQPENVLTRQSLPPAEIPRDIALELARLDEDEVSTALTRDNGQTLLFLMLCSRTADFNEDASREEVATALTEQRLTALADSHLDQLKADALIFFAQ